MKKKKSKVQVADARRAVLGRWLAKRQWLCEGCHSLSCLTKPITTEPSTLPALQHAAVLHSNPPRISSDCRGRQQGVTNVGEPEKNHPEQGRRRADISRERRRAARETKGRGRRNTCEQRLQLGTAPRGSAAFPGHGGSAEQNQRQVFSLRRTSSCFQPGRPASPAPAARNALRGSQAPWLAGKGATGPLLAQSPSAASLRDTSGARSQKLPVKRLGVNAPICRAADPPPAPARHGLARRPQA